jgi:low affinity Fe/Cu permease
MNGNILFIGKLLSSITVISMIYCIYYLISSFSNFIKNHKYREIADMKKVYDYEIKNKENKNEFDNYLKEEFAYCASHNFKINKQRTEDIAKSKKGIFVCLISTFLFSLLYIISIF